MKRTVVIIVLLALLFLAACTLQITTDSNSDADSQIYCTADVMECPDGSFVDRDPEKNCEFEECPEAVE